MKRLLSKLLTKIFAIVLTLMTLVPCTLCLAAAPVGDRVEYFSIPGTLTVTIGEVAVIEAETVPAIPPAGFTVKWNIADEKIATVDSNGIIYGLKIGETKITAEAYLNGRRVIFQTADGRELEYTTILHVAPISRDSILVLDVSGSMRGTPLSEMKKAAIAFCEKILVDTNTNNRVGLVVYDSNVSTYGLTNDIQSLKRTINNLRDGSTTNLQGALQNAYEMMGSSARAGSIKNIIVMTDGLPNAGNYTSYGQFSRKYSNAYSSVGYADSAFETAELIMEQYNLYSLGYFHSLSYDELIYAQDITDSIQNKGYYQVDRAEDLEFVFAGIAEDVNAGARLVINIACPVDVEISYGGERLSSAEHNYNGFTSFGTLYMLGKNKDIKVLTLAPNIDYNIELTATGAGEMDYTANYFDDNETIVDSRRFPRVPLTPTTYITANAARAVATQLNIDVDRDGIIDMIWEASANSIGKRLWSKNRLLVWGVVLAVIFIAGSITLIFVLHSNPNRRANQTAGRGTRMANMYQGYVSVLSGSMRGAGITVADGETLYVGRDPKWANLVLSEQQISRRHCTITYSTAENCYFVRDESQHGTYLSDGRRLTQGVVTRVEKGSQLTLASGKACVLLLGE